MEAFIIEHWAQFLALIAFTAFLINIKADTRASREDLTQHIETTTQGFAGINSRLDKVNGRIDKGEDRLQNHGERIAKLEG